MMRALRVHGYGPGDGIVLDELPMPEPGAGQVRIRVAACAISFVDLLLARGAYQVRPAPPFVPGSEFSGIVDAIGPHTTTSLQVGDSVCGTRQGAWADCICVDADRVHRLDANAPLIESAALMAPFATALYALCDRGRLSSGDTVLVLGAAGAVGHAAVQVARHRGAHVIAVAGNAAKCAAATAAGADAVVDSRNPRWKDDVKTLAGSRGVDIVVDTIGGDATDTAFRTLGWDGRHLMIGFAGGQIGALKTNLAIVKGASLIGVDFRQAGDRNPQRAAALREEVITLNAQGSLRPQVHSVLPLDRFAEAAARVQDRSTIGRVLIRFQQDPP